MFIRFHGFVNSNYVSPPSPVKSHIPAQIPVKFLPVECLSVQAFPFKTTEGELATMICLSLLQALVQNKERERERERKTLRDLLSFIQGVWDLLYHEKKNIVQIMKQDCLTWVVHRTVVEKKPWNGEEPQALTKDTFRGGMTVT